jgi:hypothetical protein
MIRKPLAGLKPVAELAADRAHGDRLRYLAGCRCDACRQANATYERTRIAARKAGDWNGIVSAAAARKHLKQLSRQNVGRKAVAAATDIALSTIAEIYRGTKRQIRARTARKILAVTAAMRSDASLVPADKTWRRIDELIEEGYTKSRIAKELRRVSRGIQLSRGRVLARSEAAIERIHRQLTA